MFKLVVHSLKSKKNWFYLNLVITAIISIIMPTLFRDNYVFFSVFTMFMTAILLIVSNFRELSFLHDDRKISYYLSKPISMMSKINVALLSNAIFSTAVFLLTFLIASLSGAIFTAIDPRDLETFNYIKFINNNLDFIKVLYAWIMMIGFVTTLSSMLTGNGAVTVFVTIFNYALPVILFLVITFICNILDNTIIGMSTDAMIQSVLDKFLPLDKIYFFAYDNDNFDIFYFINLILYFAISYVLTIFAVRTRKNERTGDFIVHNGFKYFMSIFASLLLPMFITSNMRSYNLTSVVAVLVLLSALSYYIIISILDRSFKMSKQSLQIYIPFVIIFVVTIFISSAALKMRASFIPNTSDIKAVYIGSSTDYYKDPDSLLYERGSLIKSNYEDVKDNKYLIILKEKDSIEKVIDIQKTLMSDYSDHNYSYQNFIIIYYLNNGKKVVRSYKIPFDYAQNQDKLINLARNEEFIQKRFRVFTDQDYINNVRFSYIYSYGKGVQHDFDNFDYKKFSELYMDDYRNFINNHEDVKYLNINILFDINGFNFIKNSDEHGEYYDTKSNDEYNTIYFETAISGQKAYSFFYVALPQYFTKTNMFIDSLE